MLFGKEVLEFAKQVLNSPENDHLNVVWQGGNLWKIVVYKIPLLKFLDPDKRML
jgi:hypothetical protein